MDAIGAIQAAIIKCGREVSFQKGEETISVIACIQPKAEASGAGDAPPRFGAEQAERFNYYGAASGGGERLEQGDLLLAGDGRYLVVSCRDFLFGERTAFRYAVLVKTEEVAHGAAEQL